MLILVQLLTKYIIMIYALGSKCRGGGGVLIVLFFQTYPIMLSPIVASLSCFRQVET